MENKPTQSLADVHACLDGISKQPLADSLEPLCKKIIDLFWCVSEIRPDLDTLPVIMAEYEDLLRTLCKRGDVRQAGQSVCALLCKLSRHASNDVRKNIGEACGMIESGFKAKDFVAVADGLRLAVAPLTDEKQALGTLPVFVEDDGIRIGRHFKVTFCRTLRIPDDGKTYPLPAGLGHFPLHAVSDYAQRVPHEWLGTGGFFLPMYQSEAMYLEFDGQMWQPNIAKVAVGRINAVTGNPWDERIHATKQDYLLCPHQRWLDGINAGRGFVRQFVAMPLGQGYTVEEQVTDECQFGGIQIAAFEAKLGMFPYIDPKELEKAKLRPGDLDLMAGIARLSYPHRDVLAMHLLRYSRDQIFEALKVPEDVIEEYEEKQRLFLMKRRDSMFKYKRGDGKRIYLERIQKDALAQLKALMQNQDAFTRLEVELFPYMREDSGIRFRVSRAEDNLAEPSMGIAAGGRIRQRIVHDAYGADTWDQLAKGSVCIHLVNSEVYRQITGKPPPTRPMDAARYQSLGIPWFNYYDDMQTSVVPSRILSRIKSIFAVDLQRGKAEMPEKEISIDSQKVAEIKIPSRMERIQSLLAATEAAARNGAPKSVVRLTTSILDLQKDFAPALGLRAEAHLVLGFYDEAKCDADQALKYSKHNETNVSARRVRAKVALLTGVPEMALLEAQAALRVSGNDPALVAIIEQANAAIVSR